MVWLPAEDRYRFWSDDAHTWRYVSQCQPYPQPFCEGWEKWQRAFDVSAFAVAMLCKLCVMASKSKPRIYNSNAFNIFSTFVLKNIYPPGYKQKKTFTIHIQIIQSQPQRNQKRTYLHGILFDTSRRRYKKVKARTYISVNIRRKIQNNAAFQKKDQLLYKGILSEKMYIFTNLWK